MFVGWWLSVDGPQQHFGVCDPAASAPLPPASGAWTAYSRVAKRRERPLSLVILSNRDRGRWFTATIRVGSSQKLLWALHRSRTPVEVFRDGCWQLAGFKIEVNHSIADRRIFFLDVPANVLFTDQRLTPFHIGVDGGSVDVGMV